MPRPGDNSFRIGHLALFFLEQSEVQPGIQVIGLQLQGPTERGLRLDRLLVGLVGPAEVAVRVGVLGLEPDAVLTTRDGRGPVFDQDVRGRQLLVETGVLRGQLDRPTEIRQGAPTLPSRWRVSPRLAYAMARPGSRRMASVYAARASSQRCRASRTLPRLL